MALKDRSSFSGGGIQAPSLAGPMQALQNINKLVSDYETGERLKMLDQRALEQQALDNARADARLGIAQAQEADRVKALNLKAAQDKALSDIYASVPATTTKTINKEISPAIEGTEGNISKRNALLKENANRLDTIEGLNAEVAEATDVYNAMTGVGDRTTTTIVPEPFTTVPIGKQMIGTSVSNLPTDKHRKEYRDSEGNAVGVFDQLFGGYKEVDKFDRETVTPSTEFTQSADNTSTIPSNGSITFDTPGATTMTPTLSQEEALKMSGLTDLNQRLIDIQNAKNVPKAQEAKAAKAAVTEAVKVTTGMNRDDRLKYISEQILSNNILSGPNKQAALNNLDKLLPESSKEKEAKRRAAKEWDLNTAGKIQTKYGKEHAENVAKISKKYSTSDVFKSLKYTDEKKAKISTALGLIKYGNQWFEDNDTLEMEQARAYLKTVNDDLLAAGKPILPIPSKEFW